MLTPDEISIAFKGCTGDDKITFKDHLVSLNLTSDNLANGIIISHCFNNIFSDIERLLDKAILNICSADYLIRDGFFSWGFVTSYYSNFFAIQALNRLQLNFHVWTDSNILCKVKDYVNQELEISKKDKSKNTHEIQFTQFYTNYNLFRNRTSIDRYWNIGIRPSTDGQETVLRNDINYLISKDHYYELNLELSVFKKIIQDNSKSPFTSRPVIVDPKNYSLNNLQLGAARIRMVTYLLNYIANKNREYKSYYERNMSRRRNNFHSKYPDVNSWLKDLLDEWLVYEDLGIIEEVPV